MTTPGRSSATTTGSSSGDDQWLRDFREAKQSILTTTTAPDSTPASSPQRRTAELNLGVGQLQHEIKSIVDMLQLERTAAAKTEEREADNGPPKMTDEQSSELTECVPAASPSSSLGVSSRASSPTSTSSSTDDDCEERTSSSSSSNNNNSRSTRSSSTRSDSNSRPTNPFPAPHSLSSSSPPHVRPTTASNELSSFAEPLQWPQQQHHQSWWQQQQQQPAPPSSMPSTRAAVHPTYLLAMVQEEKEQSHQQATRIQDLELALLETQQECEVAIASGRLETHELKCMLRRMASESTFADVFQVYEAHIARLEQEVHMLRERNVHLEERRQQQQLQQQQQWRDLQGVGPPVTFEGQGREGREGHDCINDDDDEEEERDDNIHHHGNSSQTRRRLLSVGTTTAAKVSQSLMAGSDVYHHQGKKSGGHACTPSGINSKSKRSKSGGMNHVSGHGEAIGSATAAATATAVALRGRIKDLQRQVGELKQETGELRRRERQFLVQKRMVETTWARVQKVQAMAKGLEGSLASCRLEGARAEARLEEAEEEIEALRQREAALVLDRDKVLLELDLVHRQLGGGCNRQDSGRRERR